LVAISQQTAANSRKPRPANGLKFPILGDHGGVIAAQFGVRWTLPDYLRVVQKALGADLTQFNGEDGRTLPMPARYVIAKDGRIAYAEVNADYTAARAICRITDFRAIRLPAVGVISLP
jgi:peroxiredoxin